MATRRRTATKTVKSSRRAPIATTGKTPKGGLHWAWRLEPGATGRSDRADRDVFVDQLVDLVVRRMESRSDRVRPSTAPRVQTPNPVEGPRRRELKSLRVLLGLSQTEMARMLGCSVRSLAKYETTPQVPDWLRARLREINTLIAEISVLLTPQELQEWMHAAIPDMQDRTPIRIIADGDAIQLFLLVRHVAMGEHV
jgi:DNA-binding transcriptional regulator YiaG